VRPRHVLFILLSVLIVITPASAQQTTPDFSQSLHWRSIGPFRGGRTRAIAGVPSQPNVFYMAQVNGGVWKSTDFGRTWNPIFDDQPTGSIGALAVSASDPDIIYAGSGEGLHRPDLSVGDGIYKSTDGGKTWTHLGLRDGQQIPQLALDPQDPNRLFVAVAGHPYGQNAERGVFRSLDGGKTFEKVLYKDEYTGASDVLIDPKNPQTVYATLWQAQEGPWENAAWRGTNGGIFKSTDGGNNWRELTGGLPQGITQAHITAAPSDSNRLFATVATPKEVKLYRSDDAGQTWRVITDDTRPAGRIGGGDLSVPIVDPKNPDIVYVTSTVTWKSIDGGRTWTGFRGAPGGDDYQNIWINPNNPDIIFLASDQGAVITVNGGASWSSWYNQPTAQLYHVSADNSFPYRLCSGQQESGSVCISSRGNDGQVTFREWHPVAAEEYGYVVADPLDPDTVYGGKLSRYDRRTDQAQNILPQPFRSNDFRTVRTEPVVFSPLDPHTLYFAANTLWATNDGGRSWRQISPDLTRPTWEVPASVGKYASEASSKPTRRGVIYAVAPSPLDKNRIWAGTDDGLIHLTTDGGAHWSNVTPPQLAPWWKVSIIDAGHFDAQSAYAAINTLRLDDLRPHIYRTHDAGKTWTEIVNGIPQNENVNVVREDPLRKGMLYAGTERAVYISFDDGDHWQSLRLNMPATSVRDLIVKDNDLAVGTHGRGFWILDDITPLRQFDPRVTAAPAYLFKPATALRIRWNMNTDTPLPPDEPAGANPPDGAAIDYYLGQTATGPVTIEIRDRNGRSVQRFSSADPIPPIDPKLRVPTYWVRPPQKIGTSAGLHRFLWDMHYPRVPGIEPELPISAIVHNTAPQPTSPWVMPGQYTVVLTANGQTLQRRLEIKMDPRVKTPVAGLQQQFDLSLAVYRDLITATEALTQANSVAEQLAALRKTSPPQSVASALESFDNRLSAIKGKEAERFQTPATLDLGTVQGRLQELLSILQEVDQSPTTQAVAAAAELNRAAPGLVSQWQALVTKDLPALNQQLRAAGLKEIDVKKVE